MHLAFARETGWLLSAGIIISISKHILQFHVWEQLYILSTFALVRMILVTLLTMRKIKSLLWTKCCCLCLKNSNHTIKVSKVIVIPNGEKHIPEGYLNYEDLVASGDESLFEPFEGDEYTAAFMCYTSGTTGKPKGILYSHRSIMLHAMSFLLSCTGAGINERDVVLPVVPMFHASAWGFPYSCTFVGATQVFPGSFLMRKAFSSFLK